MDENWIFQIQFEDHSTSMVYVWDRPNQDAALKEALASMTIAKANRIMRVWRVQIKDMDDLSRAEVIAARGF